MDFVNHNQQPAAPAPAAQAHNNKQAVSRRRTEGKGMRILTVILLVLTTLIVGLVALYLAIGDTKDEQSYVDKNKFQAIFLNGGQVYFGKVRNLNTKFITLDNIYYLRVNQQVQPNQAANSTESTANQDVSLAKLGCELHGPTDSMIINREQVLFWENLKDDGQVAKAVSDYVKANPNGQKCETPAPAADADKQ